MFSQISARVRGSRVPSPVYTRISVSISTASGSLALRARMDSPQLQRDTLLRRCKSLLHMFRRRTAGNVMAGQDRGEFQRRVEARIRVDATALELFCGELMQFAMLFQSQADCGADLLMRAAKRHTLSDKIAGGRHGVHVSATGSSLHPPEIELRRAHEPCRHL